MPLTESDYNANDSMWLYVIGWIVYLFVWSLIIGIAVWQISAQVDYNFSQVRARGPDIKSTRLAQGARHTQPCHISLKIIVKED